MESPGFQIKLYLMNEVCAWHISATWPYFSQSANPTFLPHISSMRSSPASNSGRTHGSQSAKWFSKRAMAGPSNSSRLQSDWLLATKHSKTQLTKAQAAALLFQPSLVHFKCIATLYFSSILEETSWLAVPLTQLWHKVLALPTRSSPP